jgi:hypothetical protein
LRYDLSSTKVRRVIARYGKEGKIVSVATILRGRKYERRSARVVIQSGASSIDRNRILAIIGERDEVEETKSENRSSILTYNLDDCARTRGPKAESRLLLLSTILETI